MLDIKRFDTFFLGDIITLLRPKAAVPTGNALKKSVTRASGAKRKSLQ